MSEQPCKPESVWLGIPVGGKVKKGRGRGCKLGLIRWGWTGIISVRTEEGGRGLRRAENLLDELGKDETKGGARL